MIWTDLMHVALLALLGTGHCIGMCGAFAVAAGSGEGGRPAWVARQAAYGLGKGTAYAFVGVAVLVIGRGWQGQANIAGWQDALGWIVGSIMILLGAFQLLEWRLAPGLERWWQGSRTCGVMFGVGRSASPFKGFLVGWINGFLPCGLSLAALLYLLGTGSAVTLVAGAYVFSLATLPGLGAAAALLRRWGPAGRRRLVRAAGALLILLGVLTVFRGRDAVHHWMHEHLVVEPPGSVDHAGHHAPSDQ